MPDIKRLRAIADMLDTLPSEGFDMNCWRRHEVCGTSFCAIGHAIEKGILKDLHFVARHYIFVISSYYDVEGDHSYEHIAAALKIDVDDVENLFTDIAGETPTEVAATIRAFCDKHDHAVVGGQP